MIRLLVSLMLFEQIVGTLASSSFWHAYNASLVTQNTKNNCTSFRDATRPYSQKFIDSYSLWPGLMSQQTQQRDGETLYGSEEALRLIFDNQNPKNCSTAKFLISSGWPYGFGSRIHMEGQMLAIAMELGRVYLSHPDGDNFFWETSVPFCQNKQRYEPGFQCFYMPFSKCTMKDALEGTGGDVNHLPSYHMTKFSRLFDHSNHATKMISDLEKVKSFTVDLVTAVRNPDNGPHRPAIPTVAMPIVRCSPMRKDAYHYWWRAVSATFIARPNKLTLDLLRSSAAKDITIKDYRECIAMFVRHGDKGIEMKLLDFNSYRDIAVMMWNEGLTPFKLRQSVNNKNSSLATNTYGENNTSTNTNIQIVAGAVNMTPKKNGTFFITTENPVVLEQAEAWGVANNWDIQYTNLFDRSIQTAVKTWEEKNRKGTKAVHDDLEYFSMILNLEIALKCEAWVCTLASNSCRIIDELRCTIGGKCNRYYADLSAETCKRPPCIGDNVYNFGERRRR